MKTMLNPETEWWTKIDGSRIRISDMDDQHIRNSIALLGRQIELTCEKYDIGDCEMSDRIVRYLKDIDNTLYFCMQKIMTLEAELEKRQHEARET